VLTYRDGVNWEPPFDGRVQVLRELDERTMPKRLGSILDRVGPDLVHLQSSTFLHPFSVNKSVAAAWKGPLVTTVHDAPTSLRVFYTIPALREVYRASRKIITHSAGVSATLVNFHRVDGGRIIQIPMGVDTNRYRPDADAAVARRKFALTAPQVILYFGFLRPGKGIEILMEAWGRIQRHYPDAVLVIAGGSPSRPMRYALLRNEADYPATLHRLSQSLHIGDRTVFTDYVPDDLEPGLFALANVVVFPNTSNPSQSYPLRKALSSGRPVIATDFPGFREVLGDKHEGLIVPPRNAEALANSLRFLLDYPTKADEIGREARFKAETKLNWSLLTNDVLRLYRQNV
jgi:glycosyltransferase involved in cell wall biosynthesis